MNSIKILKLLNKIKIKIKEKNKNEKIIIKSEIPLTFQKQWPNLAKTADESDRRHESQLKCRYFERFPIDQRMVQRVQIEHSSLHMFDSFSNGQLIRLSSRSV